MSKICVNVFNHPGIWFKKNQAVLLTDELQPPFSSCGMYRTVRKARRVAKGVLMQYPGAIIEVSRRVDKHKRKERVEIWIKDKHL